MIGVGGLRLGLDFTGEDLWRAVAKKLRVPISALESVRIARKSVDARRKTDVHFVCTAEVTLTGSEAGVLARVRDPAVRRMERYRYALPEYAPLTQRPVVVGFGPAGMFAALILAQCGQQPIVLERGLPVEERQKSVAAFWRDRALDPESNVQFGEGGAGAFSDGKLTTGTGDARIRKVLEELVRFGEPEAILTDAKPHIGTDRLPGVVRALRQEILRLGGEVRFSSRVTGFLLRDGKICGCKVERPYGEEILDCDRIILATGHSARDIFETVHRLGLPMEPKAFSVGARIEHPAEQIDRARYGDFAGHPALGAADYKLSCHLPSGRGVYTFCMCPGGMVTGAASEPGGVVTNGMSAYARDGANSNAALLVGVGPGDFGGEGPLAGVAFQRQIEQAAYRLAGENYNAPAQLVGDFLARRPSRGGGSVQPTYLPGVTFAALDGCLPDFVTEAMRQALPILGRQLPGFDHPEALLTGPETRSSSPVRILRDGTLQSPLAKGLYPCGEGAGYAGGIVSAAVDGIRAAEAVLTSANEKP